MASTKDFYTRIQNKHDIEDNWNQVTNFVPLVGEIIVYDKDTAHNYSRIKIGDGITNISDLPFIDDKIRSEMLPLTGGTLTGNLVGKYITGTWLQNTSNSNLGKVSDKVVVQDSAGWLYYRTPAQIISDAGVTATITELNYIDGVTSNIQTQINNLKTSFQDGCDTIMAGCTTYGDTPASNSPDDIVTSIGNIYNNRYNAGVAATKVGTATAANVLSGKTFTNSSGVGINGTMANNGAVSQTLAANGSYTIPAGYHNGSGKVTQSLTTKAATTYRASTSDQTIAAGTYLSGAQTIKKVEQSGLTAANIVKGKTVTIKSNGTNLWSVTGTGLAINPSAMKMYIGSSTPSSPNQADIFYNMSNDKYYIYNNSSWVELTKQVLQLIVFNGTSFANGYSLKTVGKNSTTVGTFFARARYNDAGGHQEWAYAWLPIDCTNFSKITVTYRATHNTYASTQIGLCNVAGTSSRFYTSSIRDNSVWNIVNDATVSTTTSSFNLASVTGVKYLAVGTDNTQGNTQEAVITKVILE